jgi:hypothetical protein
MTVKFIGTGECTWEVKARGRTFYLHGCENLHEGLARISRAHL